MDAWIFITILLVIGIIGAALNVPKLLRRLDSFIRDVDDIEGS